MKKLIILAGSPDSGKTLSSNGAIARILDAGGVVEKILSGGDGFWFGGCGGAVIIEFRGERIAVITYGDKVGDLKPLFENPVILDCDTVVCCSHAMRGRQVFDFFHEIINGLDLSKTKVIPIHKNFLSKSGDMDRDNHYTADLIFGLL